jgi:hypothetical protein
LADKKNHLLVSGTKQVAMSKIMTGGTTHENFAYCFAIRMPTLNNRFYRPFYFQAPFFLHSYGDFGFFLPTIGA